MWILFLSFRFACSIQDEDKVIITGGSYHTSQVISYNLAGEVSRLPSLQSGRSWHACGHFVHNGQVVSILEKSMLIVDRCILYEAVNGNLFS